MMSATVAVQAPHAPPPRIPRWAALAVGPTLATLGHAQHVHVAARYDIPTVKKNGKHEQVRQRRTAIKCVSNLEWIRVCVCVCGRARL